MNNSRRTAALMPALLMLASCVSGLPEPAVRDGETLYKAGDYESAVREFERHLHAHPDDAETQEKLLNARGLAANGRASRALRALRRGDLAAAQLHLERAGKLAPHLPTVRRARELIAPRLAAAEQAAALKERAEFLIGSDPESARDLLADARQLNPDDTGTIRMLREATLRAEAYRSARRATKAWDDGDRVTAALELQTARYRGKPVRPAADLLLRIQTDLLAGRKDATLEQARHAWQVAVNVGLPSKTTRALRDEATHKLHAKAGQIGAEGRPATAAMLEVEARRMGSPAPTPALDAVRERAAIRVVVFPFEDATGADADGLRIARAVRARLDTDSRGGGLALITLGAGPDAEQMAASFPRALRLTGTVRRLTVQRNHVGSRTEIVQFQTGVRVEPAPEMEHLFVELFEAQLDLEAARDQLQDARREFDRIENLPFITVQGASRARVGEAYYEQMRIRAESRVIGAQREFGRARDVERELREVVRRTPDHVEIPIYEERKRSLSIVSISAILAVDLRLTDGDDELLAREVVGSDRHRESIAPAVPEGNVPEDPDESPDDAAMARRATANFAAVVSSLVRRQAEKAARHFLQDARAAEHAGRKEIAAEAYALFLLATAEVVSPQRADAARAFEELTGITVPLRTGIGRTAK